jgi:hypothetical protein
MWDSSQLVLELPEIEFNSDDFLKEMQDFPFHDYLNDHEDTTPMQVSYDKALLETKAVKHFLNIFKDWDIPINTTEEVNSYTPGLKGYFLIRTAKQTQFDLHIDALRTVGIVFPLTFPQRIVFKHAEDPSISYVHEYKPNVITLINVKEPHMISKCNEPRVQFQLDCTKTWKEVKQLSKQL